MNLGTWIFTRLNGELVGTDSDGNRYYRERKPRRGQRERRWVIYRGEAEASRVPAEWHGWLHGRVADPPPAGGAEKKPWQAEHSANPTGTDLAYRPPGHLLRGGKRDRATGDYEAWRPS